MRDPRLECVFDSVGASIRCQGLTPLRWVACGIEYAVLWFMGRTHYRIKVFRGRLGEYYVFGCVALEDGKLRTMKWSADTQIQTLMNNNAFPARLATPFKTPEHPRTVTLIEFHHLIPECRLVTLAYGSADMAVDLFKRGATEVSMQWSVERWQVMGNVGMNRAQVLDMQNPHKASYEDGEYVSQMQWDQA